MRVNALTTETGLKVGPVVLETLIKHYFERRKTGNTTTQLRQDELLYDEVFSVVKVRGIIQITFLCHLHLLMKVIPTCGQFVRFL